jgi:hypothetical protein
MDLGLLRRTQDTQEIAGAKREGRTSIGVNQGDDRTQAVDCPA